MKTAGEFLGLAATIAQAGQVLWTQFKDSEQKKHIEEINTAWETARSEMKMAIGPIFTADGQDAFKCNQTELKAIESMRCNEGGNEHHANYREAIWFAIEHIDAYRESRFDRYKLLGKQGKANDPIDIALITARGFLCDAHKFDGSNYKHQETTLKFIQKFLLEFSKQGDERRSPCEEANTYIEMSLKHLVQMHKNRSIQQRLEEVSNLCKEAAKNSLRLVATIAQPRGEQLQWISRCDLKHVAQGNFQTQVGKVRPHIPIERDNPFRTRIQSLAGLINGIMDPASIQASIELDAKIKGLTENYLKSYKRGRAQPIIVQKLRDRSPQEGSARLEDQKMEDVQSRLQQAQVLMAFSSQVNALSRLNSLAAKHFQYYGDISIYTDRYNNRLHEGTQALLTLARTSLGNCKDLFEHILKMDRTRSIGKDYDAEVDVYAKLAKEVLNNFKKINDYTVEIDLLVKDPSLVKKEADQNEKELEDMLNQLIPLYTGKPSENPKESVESPAKDDVTEDSVDSSDTEDDSDVGKSHKTEEEIEREAKESLEDTFKKSRDQITKDFQRSGEWYGKRLGLGAGGVVGFGFFSYVGAAGGAFFGWHGGKRLGNIMGKNQGDYASDKFEKNLLDKEKARIKADEASLKKIERLQKQNQKLKAAKKEQQKQKKDSILTGDKLNPASMLGKGAAKEVRVNPPAQQSTAGFS